MVQKFLKNKIAIIGGSGLFGLDIANGVRPKTVKTSFGAVGYYSVKNKIFLNRHGLKRSTPPHKINHRANIHLLKELGVKYIFAFCSVGSLKKSIPPGFFLIPDDYINFDNITFFDKQMKFLTPEISKKIRQIFIKILNNLKIKFKEGNLVYFQTAGPRFETKAEVRMIRNFADVVGMTMAKEATLAQELGIEYACLCSVDNFANGLAKNPLSQKEVEAHQRKNLQQIEKVIKEIIGLK